MIMYSIAARNTGIMIRLESLCHEGKHNVLKFGGRIYTYTALVQRLVVFRDQNSINAILKTKRQKHFEISTRMLFVAIMCAPDRPLGNAA